jgi:hypothetical protein
MNFILQRFSDNRDSTLGLLFEKKEDGKGKKLVFLNYTLEDEYREVKESGETRIPAAFYELKIMETVTPLTKKYQEKYPWFKKHIEVTGIKNFRGVYCHIGNNDEHTDGCILFGDNADNNQIGPGSISNSTAAFKRWYERVYEHLSAGKKAFIEVRDEQYLLV